jgi:hypothetical protein
MGGLLVTILLYFLSIPYLYFTLLTAPATIVMAILALVATRTQEKASGLRVGLALGIFVSGMSMLLAVGMWVFQDMYIELGECQDRAITITAQNECQAAYDAAYEEQLQKYGLTTP